MVRPGKMAGPAEVAKNLQQEKLIMKAADKIGIDLIKEPYLRWIAEYATHPEVPDDWVSGLDYTCLIGVPRIWAKCICYAFDEPVHDSHPLSFYR